MSSTLLNIPKIDNIHVSASTLNTESEWTLFDLKYFWFIEPADNFPHFYIFFWPAQPLSAHWCQNPPLFPWGFFGEQHSASLYVPFLQLASPLDLVLLHCKSNLATCSPCNKPGCKCGMTRPMNLQHPSNNWKFWEFDKKNGSPLLETCLFSLGTPLGPLFFHCIHPIHL